MRLRALLVAAVALSSCAGAAQAQPDRERPQKRPNILVVMTDDQTLESMRVMPGVRRVIGDAGTTFDRFFVSNPLCCPSRSTFFTGEYSHNHGVLGNVPPDGGYGRLNKSEWLPIWLQRAGYRTIHIGKFLNRYGVDSPPTEVPPGWSEWYGSVDPSTYRYYGYTLNENGLLNTYGIDRNPFFYSTDYYSARALSVIQRMGETRTPFFLSVAFLAPHSGGPRDADDPRAWARPPPPRGTSTASPASPCPRIPSYNEADVADKPSFIQARPPIKPSGRGLSTRTTGSARVAAGGGRGGGEHGQRAACRARARRDTDPVHLRQRLLPRRAPLASGKVLVYEPSIRVPLLMRGPGVPRGAHRRQLITNADLAPTILDAAGARAGKPQDGRSLFGLMEDPGREWGRDLLIEGAPGVNQPASTPCGPTATCSCSTPTASASYTTWSVTPTSSRACTPIRPTPGTGGAGCAAGPLSICRAAPAGCGRRPGWPAGCRAKVAGSGIEEVRLPQRAEPRADRGRPFGRGGRPALRARVQHGRRAGGHARPAAVRRPAAERPASTGPRTRRR